MVDDLLKYSIAIGLSVGAILYLTLARILGPSTQRRPLVIFAFGLGFGVTWWLYNHPSFLNNVMENIVVKAIAILFIIIGVIAAFWKKRTI